MAYKLRKDLAGSIPRRKVAAADLGHIRKSLLPPEPTVVMSESWPQIHDLMVGHGSIIAAPDRVSTLKTDHSPIEVYSVPLGKDPYGFAKSLAEKQGRSMQPAFFLIERNGNRERLTANELISRAPAKKL